MKNAGKRLLCFIYFIVTGAFFIYYLFPSDAVKKYIAFNLNRANPELNITIDNIKPFFPPSLKLYNVSLYRLNNLLFKAEQIKIAYGVLSIFRPKTIFFFKAEAYEGILKGRADIMANKLMINADLSGIQTKDIPVVQNLSNLKISGILNGKVTYSGNREFAGTVSSKLTLSNCEVEPLTPVFNMESFRFESIMAKATMNNQKIQINECVIKGKQADGRISGSVNLKNPFGKSVLDLTGTIKPHHLLIENLQNIFSVKTFLKTDKGDITIRLYGDIDQPGFVYRF
ncbi:MAG: type II secretion system protein GspN [Deltaproteobacteria bacterium]|nr:type II secretion system protein GspN [Deltaproteobacteria bacterium]